MNDRTSEQVNSSLDRTEQILSDLTVKLDTVILAIDNTNQAITKLEDFSRRRHQQHDLEHDDHEERMEALEKIIQANDQRHQEHEKKMEKLQETQDDIRTILQILSARTAGEGNA